MKPKWVEEIFNLWNSPNSSSILLSQLFLNGAPQGFLMASSTGSPSGGTPSAIRSRNKHAASIAKRACDQCKFRKIKVSFTPRPLFPFPLQMSPLTLGEPRRIYPKKKNNHANYFWCPPNSVAYHNPVKPVSRWALNAHSFNRRRNAVPPGSKFHQAKKKKKTDAPEWTTLIMQLVESHKLDNNKPISFLEIPLNLRSPQNKIPSNIIIMSPIHPLNPAGPSRCQELHGQPHHMEKSQCQWMEQLV